MKSHRFDAISFAAGLVFLAIGLIYLIPRDVSQIIDVVIGEGSWLWPVLFLAVGVAVLLPAIRKSYSYSENDEST